MFPKLLVFLVNRAQLAFQIAIQLQVNTFSKLTTRFHFLYECMYF